MPLEAAVSSRTPADTVCSAGTGVGESVGDGVGVGVDVSVFSCTGSVDEFIQGAGWPQPPQKLPVFPVLPQLEQSQEFDSAYTVNDKANRARRMKTVIAFLIKQCICLRPFLRQALLSHDTVPVLLYPFAACKYALEVIRSQVAENGEKRIGR